MGRQRITITKIQNKARRQTTFTKRRTGLFKKVIELCELCNAEAAVITLSEADNIFANGSPNVDAVINRFLARRNPSNDVEDAQEETNEEHEEVGGEQVKKLKEKLDDALARLQVEKQKGEYLKKASELTAGGAPVDPTEEAIAIIELAQFQDKWRKEIMKRDQF